MGVVRSRRWRILFGFLTSVAKPLRPSPWRRLRTRPGRAFLNAPLTAQGLTFAFAAATGFRSAPVQAGQLEEEPGGRHFHHRCHRALRGDSLDRAGALSPGRCGVSALSLVGGLLAVGLCAYLLYAMLSPEKF